MSDPIKVDGGHFEGQDLSGQTLLYACGPLPEMLGAKLEGTYWTFDGSAARTIILLILLDNELPGYLDKVLREFSRAMPREAFRHPSRAN